MRQTIIISEEAYDAILKNQQQILKKLDELIHQKREDEFLTVKEFLAKIKMGRSKFDQLIADNEINYIRKGRKIYIPAQEVKAYFLGRQKP